MSITFEKTLNTTAFYMDFNFFDSSDMFAWSFPNYLAAPDRQCKLLWRASPLRIPWYRDSCVYTTQKNSSHRNRLYVLTFVGGLEKSLCGGGHFSSKIIYTHSAHTLHIDPPFLYFCLIHSKEKRICFDELVHYCLSLLHFCIQTKIWGLLMYTNDIY